MINFISTNKNGNNGNKQIHKISGERQKKKKRQTETYKIYDKTTGNVLMSKQLREKR